MIRNFRTTSEPVRTTGDLSLATWLLASTAVLLVALAAVAQTKKSTPAPDGRAAQGEQKKATAPQRRAVRTEAELRTNRQVQEILESIEQHLRNARWIRTHIRQEVELLGQKFTAEGEYIWAQGNRMRLELNIRVSDVTGRLLEICDGRDQWHVEEILDVKKVEHLDLEQCGDVLNDPDFDKNQRQAFLDARGFAGLAPFVDALQEFFVFTTLEKVEQDGKKILIARGTWNEEKLGGDQPVEPEPAATPDQQGQQTAQQQQQQQQERQRFSVLNLPPEMPSSIAVWIDPDGLWVRRVEMVAERAPKDRPSRLIVEFSEPELKEEVDRKVFEYQPPDDVRVADRTGVVIETLKLVLQQSQAARSASSESAATAPMQQGSVSGGGLLGPTRKPAATQQPPKKAEPKPEETRTDRGTPGQPAKDKKEQRSN